MDIYTFREKFEKFVIPFVQKPLLPDTLKLNYLGDPALTLVKELKTIDEIWDRLTESYGNARVLLHNKLGVLAKMGGLEKIRGDENLMYGISELINAMKELSRLAEKYSLEHELYQTARGLGKVKELMGASRYKKFLRTYRDVCLGYKDEWIGMYQFLQVELKDVLFLKKPVNLFALSSRRCHLNRIKNRRVLTIQVSMTGPIQFA